MKYLGVWINALLKDDDDIQRQVKSLYCAANKLRGTFDQCSPAVKNTLFRAYCMPVYACQLWSKHTQTSMKRLHAAYNNAYRIMHYIPRNVSVFCALAKNDTAVKRINCFAPPNAGRVQTRFL